MTPIEQIDLIDKYRELYLSVGGDDYSDHLAIAVRLVRWVEQNYLQLIGASYLEWQAQKNIVTAQEIELAAMDKLMDRVESMMNAEDGED